MSMSEVNKIEIKNLISEARRGSEGALGDLIVKYEPLILSLLSKYASDEIMRHDVEDIKQELLIVFCNAVMKFNLEQEEVDFGLYAKICMERALVSQLRAINRRVRIEQMPENISLHDDPSVRIIEGERVREMWKLINASLSEFEGVVWNLHLSGKKSAQIAEQLGRDTKSIDNALCRIRAKLRKALKRQSE